MIARKRKSQYGGSSWSAREPENVSGGDMTQHLKLHNEKREQAGLQRRAALIGGGEMACGNANTIAGDTDREFSASFQKLECKVAADTMNDHKMNGGNRRTRKYRKHKKTNSKRKTKHRKKKRKKSLKCKCKNKVRKKNSMKKSRKKTIRKLSNKLKPCGCKKTCKCRK